MGATKVPQTVSTIHHSNNIPMGSWYLRAVCTPFWIDAKSNIKRERDPIKAKEITFVGNELNVWRCKSI